MIERLAVVSVLFVAILSSMGCGGGGASINGTVMYQGAPVSEGSVMFAPSARKDNPNPGAPVSGQVQSSGTFTLEGVVAGPGRITYSAPLPQYADPATAKPGDLPTPSKFDGLVAKTSDVELKSGTNKIDIELVAPTK